MSRRFTAIALILQVALAHHVHAIVIRHDTGYTQYVASESQFPAVFWLEQQAARKVCVATLVHPQWALTAAHCVEESSIPESIAAAGGFEVSIAGGTAMVEQVVMHPDYRYRDDPLHPGKEVDLALLRLAQPLATPVPVRLYREQSEQDQVATLLGWGYFGIGTTGLQYDDGRFRRATNVVATANSRLRFVFDDPRQPDNKAADMEGAPGLGDSGGPALLRSDNGWELAGVAVGEVSFEVPYSALGLYGSTSIYERVSFHLEWIDSVLAGQPLSPGSSVAEELTVAQ